MSVVRRLGGRFAPEALVAVAVFIVLIAFASGYGYHRDELYFLAAGNHLDWSYADQGPFTPALARLMNALDSGSLTMLRVPSAIAAGLVVFLTGRLARELGAGRIGRLVASVAIAGSGLVLFAGHTMSTETFDLLAWTLVTWLVVKALRSGRDQLWLLVGLVLGIALLNKPLPAFLAVALLLGCAIAGPRRLLRSRWVWGGALIAVVLWMPWLIWQAHHHWPQFAVAKSIAAGGSTSSQPWWAVVPYQVLLAGPPLAPIWITGLVLLFRDPRLRDLRLFGWAWVLLAIAFMATGGKPYYLSGLLPLLIAAGAEPAAQWAARARPRRNLLIAVTAVNGVITLLVALPILPARDTGVVVAMNPDVGETIGWPEFVHTVARVAAPLPHPVIFTDNYGEAGAIDRFGLQYGLPRAYSGHNAFADWGPPPDTTSPVVVVGFKPAMLDERFRDCTIRAHVTNTDGVDNDEHGEPIAVCVGPAQPWSTEWRALKHLG